MPVKAKKAVKASKVVKAVKAKKTKEKSKPPLKPREPSLGTLMYESIWQTLQKHSEGEFDLPSMLTRYLDRSHPKFSLGLHREFYIPLTTNAQFYLPHQGRAVDLYKNQASLVMHAFGEGIKIVKGDPIRCKKHR